MAAALLMTLLLIAAAGTAGGDDGAMLPHLELPGNPDSGPAHESDALLELPGTPREHGFNALLELPSTPRAHGPDALLELPGTPRAHGPDALLELPGTPCAHGSDAPQGLMDIMSTGGCGSFAALIAATPIASEVFEEEERIAAGGGGLTVFCPDDKAVAAFEPTFRALADNDRLDVLLHHGSAALYGPKQLAAVEWVALRTLAAADAATNKSQSITVRDDGEEGWVWPSPASCQGRAAPPASVIKTISPEEGPLAVYLVDAVLLPGHLRQKQDGGYLDWLHCSIPVWAVLLWVLVMVVSFFAGYLGRGWWESFGIKDAAMH